MFPNGKWKWFLQLSYASIAYNKKNRIEANKNAKTDNYSLLMSIGYIVIETIR